MWYINNATRTFISRIKKSKSDLCVRAISINTTTFNGGESGYGIKLIIESLKLSTIVIEVKRISIYIHYLTFLFLHFHEF